MCIRDSHNMLQTGFENMDDHEFIRSVAKKHGVTFSKPGNGVCHQLQLENFSKMCIRYRCRQSRHKLIQWVMTRGN